MITWYIHALLNKLVYMLDSLMAGHYIGQKKRLDTEELRFYRAEREEFTVEDGCFLRGTRVVIPCRYWPEVLCELHLISHPEMVRMNSLARFHVWWPNLDNDIERSSRDCSDYQVNRCRAPLKLSNPRIWPTRPWQRLHVDFAGPCNGGMFLIVFDAKSKWMEVV